MIKLHQHHISLFRRDRKAFYNQFVLRLPEANPDYFKIGRAVDIAVKCFHLHNKAVYPMDYLPRAQVDLVEVMIRGYIKKYQETSFRNFSVPLYEIPMGEFLLQCSPDLVADDIEGNGWIIELKTGVQHDALDFQTLTYCWAYYKINGYAPAGLLKRTVRKPTIKQRKKETPEEFSKRLHQDYDDRPDNYYKAEAVEVPLAEILEHEKYIKEILRSINRALKNGRYSFY